jgi:general secretion pathway protein H
MKQRASQSGSFQRGFTLLELLVVLMIIGIIVSMATLSVGGNETRTLRDEAQRLSALLELASQQSMLKGVELALRFEDNGYSFFFFDGEKWQPLEDDGPLRERELPQEISVSASIEGEETKQDLFGEDQPSQIWILSSGEMSPFVITLKLENGPSYQLSGDLLGALKLEGPVES